jgi:hypothetical protein
VLDDSVKIVQMSKISSLLSVVSRYWTLLLPIDRCKKGRLWMNKELIKRAGVDEVRCSSVKAGTQNAHERRRVKRRYGGRNKVEEEKQVRVLQNVSEQVKMVELWL